MSDASDQPPRPTLKRTNASWARSAATIASVVSWIEIVAVALVATLLYASLSPQARTPVKAAVGWDPLRIDGNRAKGAVLFPHAVHVKWIGASRQACMTCHHMSKPMDGPTDCATCHRDMYASMSIFDHDSHRKALGPGKACNKCHPKDKAKEHVKPCKECHEAYTKAPSAYVARSYESAMHTQCVRCHKEQAEMFGRPELAKCLCCHKDMQGAKGRDVPPIVSSPVRGAAGGQGSPRVPKSQKASGVATAPR